MSGTTHFFTCATAYMVLWGRRHTLAIARVRKGDRMDRVLNASMRRLQTLGVKLRLLLVDRGFYSVRVIRYLILSQQSFIMPAIKQGNKVDDPGGPTGIQAIAQAKSSHWTSYTLSSPGKGEVSFDLAVVCRNLNGKWGRHERAPCFMSPGRVRGRSLNWIRKTYRGRFGIESSYRQLNQARIRTSTRNLVLRLLFVGVT